MGPTYRPNVSSTSLSIRDLSYDLGDGRSLFNELELSIHNSVVGLVGENGSGKTTLLRLIAGQLQPSQGEIHRGVPWAYLPQHPQGKAGERVVDMLGIGPEHDALCRVEAGRGTPKDFEIVGDDWGLETRAQALLGHLGLSALAMERLGGTLSGGEATRVRLAGCLLSEPGLLVLDEPTNNMDRRSRRWLMDALEAFDGAVLIASHDRELLEQVDWIYHLRGGGGARYGGGYSHFEALRAQEEAGAMEALARAKSQLRRTEAGAQRAMERQAQRAERGRRLRSSRSHGKSLLDSQLARFESTTSALKSGWAKKVEAAGEALAVASTSARGTKPPRMRFPGTAVPQNKTVVSAGEARFAWPGQPRGYALDLTIVGPERVALVGPSGIGKTTVAKLLLGRLAPDSGSILQGVGATAWMDQDLGILEGDRTPFETLQALNPTLGKGECQAILASFQLRGELAHRPARYLSGGQRTRGCLACILGAQRPPQLLCLDEPTNNLDLDTLAHLEEALGGYEGALLVISHDGAFLEAVGVERRLDVGGMRVEVEGL